MADIRILFLSPNWRVAIVKTFHNSSVGHTLIGADCDPHSAALKVMDLSYVIPRFSEQGCAEEVLNICQKENIQTILPMTNKAIAFMNENRDRFDKADLSLYLNDASTIQICNDKRKLADFFKENDIASPDLVNPNDPFPGFPLVTKESCGEGGKNFFTIKNQSDLDFYSKKLPDHVFQRFVQGREFSIDWFADKHGVPVVTVPRERLAVCAGEVMKSRIELNLDIIESAKKVGTRLQLRGPANLQGILDESGKFLFTDVNLRFGSGVVHSIHAGADIPGMIFKELAGKPIDGNSNSVTNGSTMSRFHDALFDS